MSRLTKLFPFRNHSRRAEARLLPAARPRHRSGPKLARRRRRAGGFRHQIL